MDDFVPSLIGGGFTALVALIGVAFGYGKLSQKVDDVKEAIGKVEQRLGRLEEVVSPSGVIATLRERVAKLEAHAEPESKIVPTVGAEDMARRIIEGLRIIQKQSAEGPPVSDPNGG